MQHINFTIITITIIALASSAGAAVLYDGAIGGTPNTQGWNYLTDPLGGASATHSESGGVTTLDTTPVTADSAGYFSEIPQFGLLKHPSLGALDRNDGDGFTLRLTAMVVSELHTSIDRAGFSIIVLTSDNKGIELAFWPGTVWAQSTTFTHAEEIAFATNAAMVVYDVAVQDNGYDLYADDALILSGSLRDYSAHPHPVYSETDFLFFGDDTSSAQAEVDISYVEVLDYAVPEPATLTLLALAGAALLRRRR